MMEYIELKNNLTKLANRNLAQDHELNQKYWLDIIDDINLSANKSQLLPIMIYDFNIESVEELREVIQNLK